MLLWHRESVGNTDRQTYRQTDTTDEWLCSRGCLVHPRKRTGFLILFCTGWLKGKWHVEECRHNYIQYEQRRARDLTTMYYMIDVSNSGAYFTALSSSRIGFDWLGKPGPELEAINFHLLLAAQGGGNRLQFGPGKMLKGGRLRLEFGTRTIWAWALRHFWRYICFKR